MRIKNWQKFNESPNILNYYDEDSKTVIPYEWNETDENYVFSYYDGKFFCKQDYLNHYDLFNVWANDLHKNDNDKYKEIINKVKDYESKNGRGELSGRLFDDIQVVTFWRFPKDHAEMMKLVEDIKETVDIDISDWEVEILLDEEKEMRMGFFWCVEAKTKIIPVKDYKGSKERSSEELAKKHLEVGKGENVPKGWGSRTFDEKLPKGMSDVEYKNNKTKYKYTEGYDPTI